VVPNILFQPIFNGQVVLPPFAFINPLHNNSDRSQYRDVAFQRVVSRTPKYSLALFDEINAIHFAWYLAFFKDLSVAIQKPDVHIFCSSRCFPLKRFDVWPIDGHYSSTSGT
jgi:hypothetical protein